MPSSDFNCPPRSKTFAWSLAVGACVNWIITSTLESGSAPSRSDAIFGFLARAGFPSRTQAARIKTTFHVFLNIDFILLSYDLWISSREDLPFVQLCPGLMTTLPKSLAFAPLFQ